jgi:hypothetical protein
MALELDPDWPGLDEDKDGNYTNRTEIKRIGGELNELIKKLTTSSGTPVTEFAVAPGDPIPEPQLPADAGSLPDLQRYCGLSEKQLGEWTTAMQFSLAITSAYSVLIGEQGSTGGLYAGMTARADVTIDALFDTAKASQGAEHATQEAAARQEV